MNYDIAKMTQWSGVQADNPDDHSEGARAVLSAGAAVKLKLTKTVI